MSNLGDMANMYDDMAKMWARAMTAGFAPFTGIGQEDGGSIDPRAVIDRLTEAHMTAVDGGYRYSARWTELAAKAYPLAVKVLTLSAPGADGAQLGTAMDELRETLREMFELPFREAQRWQGELYEVWSRGMTAESEADSGATEEDDVPVRRQRSVRAKE